MRRTATRVRSHRIVLDPESRPYCGLCQLPYRHPSHLACAYCRRVLPGSCEHCTEPLEVDPEPVLLPDPMLWDDDLVDTPDT